VVVEDEVVVEHVDKEDEEDVGLQKKQEINLWQKLLKKIDN
jgi:hypothetical protein